MVSDWREVRVEDIKSAAPSALATGPFGSAISSRFFQDSGVPVLRGSNLSEDVGRRLVEDDLAFLSPEKASEFKRSIARRGDLVFTCWGTIGQVGLVDDRSRFPEYVVSNKQMKLTPEPATADSLFLYYLFSNPEMVARVRNAGIGSSVPGFNLGQLRQMPILLPPLAEQRRIAGILGALDDKIELNRRMSQTLESMARALFKSWFVDFDPVRAKAAGRDPGLQGRIADLFPDSFEDSELGEIPAGWRQGRLGDVLDQRIERCAPSADTASRPYVPIECISPRSLSLAEARPGEEAQSSLTRFHRSDLLFGAMRPYFHKVCIAPFDGTTRTTAFVLHPRRSGDLAFGALWLHSPDTIDYATQHSTGSTIPYAVWAKSLEDMPGILPPPEVRDAFGAAVAPLIARLQEPYFQSQMLASTRDALLPALLSGPIGPGVPLAAEFGSHSSPEAAM